MSVDAVYGNTTVTTQEKTAAITGAAGGLGVCFAEQLAQRGYHLILADRRETELTRICESLKTKYHVAAEPWVVDLTDDNSVTTLVQKLVDTSRLEMLVNNAGFGLASYFMDADVERHLDMIRVHVLAVIRLTHAVLPAMIARRQGAVINVSSLNAWMPFAGVVSYASTKAHIAVFVEALHDELRGTNVRVQALCTGFVRTGFHDTHDMGGFDARQVPTWMWMKPEDVVDCSLKKLASGRAIVVPGLVNRLSSAVVRLPIFQPLVRVFVRQDRETLRASRAFQQGI